ncbi:MFS transporter [Caballeronia sp. dw_276]|uniref:MFS transporter n=1 Tax=Caballeronia sp. dw_276 TaxID=2719795 RepID=UPI003211C47A
MDKTLTGITPAVVETSRSQRYIQLLLLVIAAGAIYPLLYLRQVYQTPMLEFFHIDNSQLGYLYSILGTVFLLCYLPSGWLADRIAPRFLICFSLIATGALGLVYSTAPSLPVLLVVFCCWGLTTGLTFWASILKRVKTIAAHDEQGRFFGLLDGGRGLIEALLATIALVIFAAATEKHGLPTNVGFRYVVYLYSGFCIGLGLLMVMVKEPPATQQELQQAADNLSQKHNLWRDLVTLMRIPQLWLMAAVVFCGYQIFWATYSFSAYLQVGDLKMTVVMAGTLTTLKLWMRPIGGIGGGYLGDRFSTLGVLSTALFLAAIGLVALAVLPTMHIEPRVGVAVIAVVVLVIGILTYAIRGLYWSLLDDCGIPLRITGLAIGLVSLIGYSPDVFLPLVNGWTTEHFPGLPGYQIYFSYIAVVSVIGGVAALALMGMRKTVAKDAIR